MTRAPRRQRRAPFDASLAWALAAVIAVAAIVGLAILLTRPAPVNSPGGGSVDGSPTPSEALQGRTPSSVEDGTWWRVGWMGEPGDGGVPDELVIGTLAGRITARLPFPELQVSGPPYVRGPVAGQVLLATQAGRTTQLQLVDAATGRGRLVGEVAPSALDAALTPDAGAIVYLAETDGGLAAYAMPVGGTGDVRRLTTVEPRLAAAPGIVLAARVVPRAELLLSPDAERLAILDCLEVCRLRVVAIDSGEQVSVNLDRVGGLLGWGADEIGLNPDRCFDLDTLEARPEPCADAAAAQPGLRHWLTGVELPTGWRAEIGVDDADGQIRAIAIGPQGEEVVLEPLGTWGTNG